jgi:hypothetical protein
MMLKNVLHHRHPQGNKVLNYQICLFDFSGLNEIIFSEIAASSSHDDDKDLTVVGDDDDDVPRNYRFDSSTPNRQLLPLWRRLVLALDNSEVDGEYDIENNSASSNFSGTGDDDDDDDDDLLDSIKDKKIKEPVVYHHTLFVVVWIVKFRRE